MANGPWDPAKGKFEAMDVCTRLLGLKFWRKHVGKPLHPKWSLIQEFNFPDCGYAGAIFPNYCTGLHTGDFTYIWFKIKPCLAIELHYIHVCTCFCMYYSPTLYLAVIHFGSHHSFHIFFFHGRGNTKTVPHAEYFCSSIRVRHFHRAIQNDWPGIQLQIKCCRTHENWIT